MKLPIALYRPQPQPPRRFWTGQPLPTPRPVYMVSCRHPHHAGPSGYDRLCDYIGETVRPGKAVHVLGETLLRLPAKLTSWYGPNFEYSRHDFVMECEVALHMLRRRGSIYHFIYGEKSFMRLAAVAGRNDHRFVATFHHPAEHYGWLFRSTRHLAALHHVITMSTRQVPFLENLVGRGKVTFVPHGVDTTFYQPAARREERRGTRCLFIGDHERDYENLPAIVSGILSAMPETEFTMISPDARCRNALRDHRTQWLKNLPDSEYLRCLQNADLLVLPLKLSTAVQAALESMACGVPVVTNAGGISDYLDDTCAVQVPTGDVKAMVEAAVELLRDEPRRQRMMPAARAKSLAFSWPNVAAQTVEIYRRVTETGRPS